MPNRTVLQNLAVAAGFCVFLTGCATMGPDFQAPAAPAGARFAMEGDAAPQLDVSQRSAGPWWKAFGSPDLDAIMVQALKDNATLAAADATLEKSRLDYEALDALTTPQVVGSAGVARTRINTHAFGFSSFSNPTVTLYTIGASVAYDLDLFGAGRRGREAGRARVEAVARRADAAYLTLTGKVALQAIHIAALRAEIEAARAVVADGEQTLDIARKAEEAGAAAPASLSAAAAQLAADRAQLPGLESQLAQARHALAVLVGQPPGAWSAPAFELTAFAVPGSVPVGLPSELVRRRPDILEAEAALHAATADIGVETALLYPNLRLTAGYSQGAIDGRDLFSYDSSGWNFGPQVSLPLIDGGRRKALRDAAVAEAKAADALYRQTVLSAFAQVSDALDAVARDDAQLSAINAQIEAARQNFEDSRKAYDLGGGTLLAVVDAQRQLSRARRVLAQAQGARFAHLVQLFAAVAADWRAA